MRARAVALAMAVLVVPWSAAAHAGGAEPDDAALETEMVGGRLWTTDRRLTDDLQADTAPHAVVDADGTMVVLWRRATLTGEAYFAATVDPMGAPRNPPTFITDAAYRDGAGGVPVGRAADVDSNGRVHVAHEQDGQNILYSKLDLSGKVIVHETQVGPRDSYASRTPALAVGIDDTVHIAHRECRFQCEDIAYDKLANDGGDIWIDRVVSSDVAGGASSVPHIVADRYNGNIMFVFSTASGMWLGHFNKFGVKDMPSVLVRPGSSFQVADATAAPNGSMHFAWVEAGNVLYSVVNSTGKIVVDAVTLDAGGTALGVPRLAAASNGTVHIVWADGETGVPQVMYARVGRDTDLAAVGAVQLTNSTGGASEPAIAIGPGDGVHAVWVDERDGNREVYFKFAVPNGCALLAEPLSINGMFFLHPNETDVRVFTVLNKGLLPRDFALTLGVVPSPTDWTVWLNTTSVAGLGPGQTADVALTVTVPATAREGDNISLTIRLASADGECSKTIQFPLFVQVSRELRFSGEWRATAASGETVAFALFVTNRGDVPEEDIRLEADTGGLPGWGVSLSLPRVSLEVGQRASFNASVAVPPDLPGGTTGLVRVRATTGGDLTVRALMALEVTVEPTVGLEVVAMPAEAEAPPGRDVTVRLRVTNTGNTPGPEGIRLTATPLDEAPWPALLNRTDFALAGGESAFPTLRVSVPSGAPEGLSQRWGIQAVATARLAMANATVTATARHTCGIQWTVGQAGDATPGLPAVRQLWLSNLGTGWSALHLSVTGLPPGWAALFVQGGREVTSVWLSPSEQIPLELQVIPDRAAEPGTTYLQVVAEGDACGVATGPVTLAVRAVRGASITAAEAHTVAAPGGFGELVLNVTNVGNGPAWIRVFTQGLPTSFAPGFDCGGEFRDPAPVECDGIRMEALESRSVTLRVAAPHDSTLTEVPFAAWASTDGGTRASVALMLEVVRPNLAVRDERFSPVRPAAGEPVVVTITVANTGTGPSGPSRVLFSVDGVLAGDRPIDPLDPGAGEILQFTWGAQVGTHRLEVRVVHEGDVGEASAADNLRSMVVAVVPAVGGTDRDPAGGAGPPAAPVAGAAAAALLATALVAILALRRRSR